MIAVWLSWAKTPTTAMNNFNIPIRPNTDFPMIAEADKDCLTYSVLWGVPNEVAFVLFNPALAAASGGLSAAGVRRCEKFFAKAENVAYLEAYKQALSGYSHPKEHNTNNDAERGKSATTKLMRDCMSAIEANRNLDPEILRDFVMMFKALGLLKEDASQQEAPRRYLPVRCLSECQYRLFCEQALEKGDIENECLYCKALAIAQEHGYKYDPKTNLNIPQEKFNLIH